MDFVNKLMGMKWARLIGGAGASPSSKQSSVHNPQQRLARFKRLYNQLLQAWRNAPSQSANPSTTAIENLRLIIQQLTSLLHEESRFPPPHPCIQYFASLKIYVAISKIATNEHDEGLIRDAISVFTTVLDSEDEEFTEGEDFAKALISFAEKAAGTGITTIGSDTEGDLMQLLFGITAKIRLQPEILPVWFKYDVHATTSPNGGDERGKFVGAAHKNEFPLLYLLVDFVHHEGKVGDFARTGLLYIIESASKSADLEHWIVESDLATLMASGLGALYSQLSRKLVMSFSKDETPVILSLSDYGVLQAPLDAEKSTSPYFQGHMSTFLSYLMFWQDVLEHCRSVEVKQSLLDHFQILFLQQLLYPSLLESSDADGGSSVAVLTYLRRILESLDHPDLIRLILHYLLALPDQSSSRSSPPVQILTVRARRKTLDLIALAEAKDMPTPKLFNLVDLILTSLRSKNQQTIAATLSLISVILKRHHKYAISTILRTTSRLSSDVHRTAGAHEQELDVLFSMVTEIESEGDFEESYDNHLRDNLNLLECHPCSARLLAVGGGDDSSKTSQVESSVGSGPNEVSPHLLRLDDPILKRLLEAMETFFTNSVDTNLGLTEAIIDLASCCHMSIEGWLVPDPANYEYADNSDFDSEEELDHEMLFLTGEDSDEAIERHQVAAHECSQRQPSWSAENTPPVIATLQSLVKQLSALRSDIPDFNVYLRGRKKAFEVNDDLEEAPAPAAQPLPRPPRSTNSPKPSIVLQKMPTLDSMSRRMFTDKMSTNDSRSTSPVRGRQHDPRVSDFATPTRVGKLGQHHLMGSPSPSQRSRIAMSVSPSRRGKPKSRTRPQPSDLLSTEPDLLRRKIDIQAKGPFAQLKAEELANNKASSSSMSGSEGGETQPESLTHDVDASVSHILTNTIILQEFILELAALIQVRASLFAEIKFM
ncbi:MAG: hypothetical protein M1827_002575 [Pycnora praestabilis]|nr:MAG: hypothetical protein M1827_002575 [Pycnora praestabilis]